MVTYIYFVKCPDCEDEHFDFFDEAKDFAMGCLSKKPIITQTEVNRNDFGECVDHCDLGTVWSWEDMMKDTEEPKASVFSKSDLSKYNPDNDPEFADDDFFAINNSDASESEIEPISTVDDAVDFLVKDEEEAIAGYEKVEDAVKDFDAENKEEILDTIDHIKEEEEEHIEELEALVDAEEVDQDEEESLAEGFAFSLNNEKDLTEFTKLCQEVGIKTVGDLELFTRETADKPGNILDKLRAYRDELGDDFKITEHVNEERPAIESDQELGGIDNAVVDCKAAKVITHSEDEKPVVCERKPVPEGMTIEQLVETMEENEDEVECTWCNDVFPKDMCKKEVNLGYLCPRCADGIMSRGETLTFKENNYWDFLDEAAQTEEPADEKLSESFDPDKEVDFYYDDLTFTVNGTRRDADDWDEYERGGSYTYTRTQNDVAVDIWENFITEEDVKDVEGGLATLEDNDAWLKYLDTHFDALLDKYYDNLLDYYEDNAAEKLADSYSYLDDDEYFW